MGRKHKSQARASAQPQPAAAAAVTLQPVVDTTPAIVAPSAWACWIAAIALQAAWLVALGTLAWFR